MHQWARKIHLWLGLLFTVPTLMIFTTGVLLQLKNDVRWIQPEVMKASGNEMKITLPEILELSRSIPEAGIEDWADISQVDWRPNKGLIRVRSKDWNEIQIDTSTKKVLNTGKRWTALIIAIHEGSQFSPFFKYGVFLPTAVALWFLWVTGTWMGIKTLSMKYFKKGFFNEKL